MYVEAFKKIPFVVDIAYHFDEAAYMADVLLPDNASFERLRPILDACTRRALENMEEARAYHTIAIGCTGGQHRSVALVELLAEHLGSEIPALVVVHRELKP